VKSYVSQLSQATGQHPAAIYSALYTAFNVPRYQELLEVEWEQVERWFQSQLERKRMCFHRRSRYTQRCWPVSATLTKRSVIS